MRRDDDGSRAGQRLELAIEQRSAGLIQSGERLVEDEQLGVVEQSPAEREPLRHPSGVRRYPLVARLPQGEALEEHADPLASLRHAVEPADRGRGSRRR